MMTAQEEGRIERRIGHAIAHVLAGRVSANSPMGLGVQEVLNRVYDVRDDGDGHISFFVEGRKFCFRVKATQVELHRNANGEEFIKDEGECNHG